MPGFFVIKPAIAAAFPAHKVLGSHRIARLQRLDDVHMVADRAIGAVVLADRLAADHPHMREQVFG
jgi:hypothetical protein